MHAPRPAFRPLPTRSLSRLAASVTGGRRRHLVPITPNQLPYSAEAVRCVRASATPAACVHVRNSAAGRGHEGFVGKPKSRRSRRSLIQPGAIRGLWMASLPTQNRKTPPRRQRVLAVDRAACEISVCGLSTLRQIQATGTRIQAAKVTFQPNWSSSDQCCNGGNVPRAHRVGGLPGSCAEKNIAQAQSDQRHSEDAGDPRDCL